MQHDHPTAMVSGGFRKTRIAPTPSGYLHIGNVLSFVLTATLAERYGARILLRIDDMDRERFGLKYVRDIFDTLHFLELPWHEGPENEQSFLREYSQVHRMQQYDEALKQLRDRNVLFACNCSRSLLVKKDPLGRYLGHCLDSALPFAGENVCWRLKTDDTPVAVKTLSGTILQPLPDEVQYFVVRKKDKHPAYQLGSLVDDLYFGIDFIVRGEDLWPSTLAQCYLAQHLGATTFLQNTFYHHGLINGTDGAKLSKSAGATSIRYLRAAGKKPSDIYTMIGHLLGIQETITDWHTLGRMLLKDQQ